MGPASVQAQHETLARRPPLRELETPGWWVTSRKRSWVSDGAAFRMSHHTLSQKSLFLLLAHSRSIGPSISLSRTPTRTRTRTPRAFPGWQRSLPSLAPRSGPEVEAPVF